MVELIYEHQTVAAFHFVEEDYISIHWKGKVELPIYKEALLACLQCAVDKQLNFFLIDQKDLEYVGSEAQAWLYVNWFPKIENGVDKNLYFAIITSKKLFVEMASKIIARKLEQNKNTIFIQYFDNRNDGLEWLMSHGKNK